MLAAGVAVELWVAWLLGWRRALEPAAVPLDPDQPALVLAGPFRIVRQPQALGIVLMLAGTALARRTPAAAAVALLGAGLVIALARRYDAELARRHGEAHARYRRAVPLLVPRAR